jgi:molecular chaperone GrpE
MAANLCLNCQFFGFHCIGSIIVNLPLQTFLPEINNTMSHFNDTEPELMNDVENGIEAGGAALNADDNVAGTLGLEDGLDENDVTDSLKKELEEQKDKYLRLFAEFDNFKRRTAKERLELMQTAGREIMTSLLDVLDDFERTEKVFAESTDIEAAKQGVNLVFQKFRSILEQKGLKAMSAVSADFDADFHEAITEIPAPSEALKGKVIDELQKGYTLGGKIIRYAKVVVGK